MSLAESLGVRHEGAKAGFRAKINSTPVIFNTREITRVCVTENAATEGSEL